MAGKAHPRDDAGKQLIRQVAALHPRPAACAGASCSSRTTTSASPATLVAGLRRLAQHAAPALRGAAARQRHEGRWRTAASTLSTLDGWWDEAWIDRDLLATPFGWAVGGRSLGGDEQRQDADDAESLYALLEREIVPTFYDRDAAGLPREWLARMKSSIANLGPVFNAHRMVADYVSEAYGPRS